MTREDCSEGDIELQSPPSGPTRASARWKSASGIGKLVNLKRFHVQSAQQGSETVSSAVRPKDPAKTHGKDAGSDSAHSRHSRGSVAGSFPGSSSFRLQPSRSSSKGYSLVVGEERCWIFEPSHPLKRFWDPLMGLIVIYVAIVVPFRVGFDLPASDNGWSQFETSLDVLFILDVVLQFVSAYENGEGVLVRDPKTIFWHYTRTWLFIDLVASIPFDVFLSPSTTNDVNRLSKIARVAKLARSLRLLRLFKLLRISRASRLLNRIELALQCNLATTRLLKTLVVVLTMGHFISCMWHYTALVAEDNDIAPQHTWTFQYGVAGESVLTRYVSALYWTFITLTTVGFGDIRAHNDVERMFCVVVCIIGGIWYAAMLSSMTQLMRSFDRRTTMKRQRMEQLDRFVRDFRIRPDIRKRLRHHFEVSLAIAKPAGYDVERLLKSLDTNLRVDVLCWIHRHIIAAVPLIGEQRDRVFAAEFARHLYPLTVGADFFVQRAGAHALDMFFIQAGSVRLDIPESSASLEEQSRTGNGAQRRRMTMLEDLVNSDEEDEIINSIRLGPGDFFGEVGCLITNVAFASALSLEACEMFGISKVNLWKVLEEFPTQEARLLRLARQRLRLVSGSSEANPGTDPVPSPPASARQRSRAGSGTERGTPMRRPTMRTTGRGMLPRTSRQGRTPPAGHRVVVGSSPSKVAAPQPQHGPALQDDGKPASNDAGRGKTAGQAATDPAEIEVVEGGAGADGVDEEKADNGSQALSQGRRSGDVTAPLSNLVIALTGQQSGFTVASTAPETGTGERSTEAPGERKPLSRLRQAVKSGRVRQSQHPRAHTKPVLPSPAILQLRLFNSLERYIADTRAELLDGQDALHKQLADIVRQMKQLQGSVDELLNSSM